MNGGMGVCLPDDNGCPEPHGGPRAEIFPGSKKVKSIEMTEQKKRGGARPGAGRKKGSVDKRFMQQPEQAKRYAKATTPIAYLIAVMTDPAADFRRRDRAARAAARYIHAKPAPTSKASKATN